MQRTRQPIALEPQQSAVFWVIFFHAILIGAVVWWANPRLEAHYQLTPPSTTFPTAAPLQWLHPSVFRRIDRALPGAIDLPPASSAPSPETPPATADSESQSARFITLFRRNIQPQVQSRVEQVVPSANPATPPRGPDVLPDKHLYAELDRIDEAIHQAFMQVWQPPSSTGLASAKRSARLDLSLNFALEIEQADLVSPSGAQDFDLSILDAVDRVKQLLPTLKGGGHSIKIPHSLPSTFQNLRYDCRIQFQIE